MYNEKFERAIKYVAEKNNVTEKQAREAWESQFGFSRHAISQLANRDTDYFPTIFLKGFLTFGFTDNSWKKFKAKKSFFAKRRQLQIKEIHEKIRSKRDETVRCTEE